MEIQRRQEAAEAQAKANHHQAILDKPDVHNLLEVWGNERERLEHYEHAIANAPDLTNLITVVNKPKHYVNVEFRENEGHRHDSLLDEIAHSIDTDPYLAT